MLEIGSIGFLNPWFLAGLAALPILWWLLRATPPRPRREAFPGVAILLSLKNEERTPQRTPWWLLLLRVLAAALLLGAFADPLLNPTERDGRDGPLLIVMDGGWTSAPTWEQRRAAVSNALARARDAERPVALVVLAEAGPAPETLSFGAAEAAIERAEALVPAPWRPDPTRLTAALAAYAASADEALETIWLTDGLSSARVDGDEDATAALAARLSDLGPLTLYRPERGPVALVAPEPREDALAAIVIRASDEGDRRVALGAFGAARSAVGGAEGQGASGQGAGSQGAEGEGGGAAAALGRRERRLADASARFESGERRAEALFTLPLELRNALTRVAVLEGASAGGVALLDDSYRRRRVAIISGEEQSAGLALLSGSHYLMSSLEGAAALRETTLEAALGLDRASVGSVGSGEETVWSPSRAWADVILLADVGRLDTEVTDALAAWLEAGGSLIRFAGPRLAAAAATDATARRRGFLPPTGVSGDPLLPVRLRGGGRALSGALSWSQPQTLSPFPAGSPFAGLTPPSEVTVTRQVLAEPGPELAERVWASLSDGTPLVTARPVGQGRVTLFHVTASPDWSSLPLSGLFVDMLGRLVAYSPAVAGGGEAAVAEGGAAWRRVAAVDGFGDVTALEGLDAASAASAGGAIVVDGATLMEARRFGATALAPPGAYARETQTGASVSVSLSAVGTEERLEPASPAPAGAQVLTLSERAEVALKPLLLGVAFGLLALDVLAALFVAGRLPRRAVAAVLAVTAGLLLAAGPDVALAQQTGGAEIEQGATEAPIDPAEQFAALESVLAHVRTGDAEVDRVTASGLAHLSQVLRRRSAVSPGEPAMIDLSTDDAAVYSLIYWPITASQPELDAAAVRNLNLFLRTGGLLIVDTRDANLGRGRAEGPNAVHLRRLLAPIDMPPLEPMDRNHLMTRTFYIVAGAPGRWRDDEVWVQAGTGGGSEGLNSQAVRNDGVSSVLIGGGDWAAAWAHDERGRPLLPMGGGDERRRDLSLRFGVNLVMYAYTGSYKSDQVHIETLLDRLGN